MGSKYPSQTSAKGWSHCTFDPQIAGRTSVVPPVPRFLHLVRSFPGKSFRHNGGCDFKVGVSALDEAGGRDRGAQEKGWLYDSDAPRTSRMVVGEVFSETFQFSKVETLSLLGKYFRKRERGSRVFPCLIILLQIR
jgi:hypothetical protein